MKKNPRETCHNNKSVGGRIFLQYAIFSLQVAHTEDYTKKPSTFSICTILGFCTTNPYNTQFQIRRNVN